MWTTFRRTCERQSSPRRRDAANSFGTGFMTNGDGPREAQPGSRLAACPVIIKENFGEYRSSADRIDVARRLDDSARNTSLSGLESKLREAPFVAGCSRRGRRSRPQPRFPSASYDPRSYSAE